MDNTQIKIKSNAVSYSQLNFFLLIVSLSCCLLILIGMPLKVNFIVSLGTRVMILMQLFVVLLMDVVIYGKGKFNKEQLLFLLLLVSLLVCSVLYYTILFSHYINFICYLMLPMFMLSSYRLKNVKAAKTLIYIFNFIFCVFYIYLYFSPLSHIFYGKYGIENIIALTLGYDNPNQTGMILMVSFIIALSCFNENNSLTIKFISFITAVILFYFIYCTASRTCIIITIIISLLFLFRLLRKINIVIINIAFIIPVIFFIIALIFPTFMKELIVFSESADSGRTLMYSNILSSVDFSSFIFGNFKDYVGSNLHNSYFTLFMTFGLLGLVVYLVFIREMSIAFYRKMRTSKSPNYVAFAGVLGIIVHGATESAFLTSGVYYAVLASLIFVLCLPAER